nr:E-beta-farnesene synthase 1 [Tanacetum cinerariifolium]GEY51799.1 E-beta-farnesene synthase 1 [Tanacetum cinerariifolium]
MVTSTYGLMIARSYVGRGDIVTEDSFKWVSRYPPIVKASCVILRLMDDIVSHKGVWQEIEEQRWGLGGGGDVRQGGRRLWLTAVERGGWSWGWWWLSLGWGLWLAAVVRGYGGF